MKKKEILDIDFDVNNEEELTKLFDKYWGTIYFILLPFLSGISIWFTIIILSRNTYIIFTIKTNIKLIS